MYLHVEMEHARPLLKDSRRRHKSCGTGVQVVAPGVGALKSRKCPQQLSHTTSPN